MGAKVLITGGTGLIGKRLTQLLLKKGYEVAYLSRKKEEIPDVAVYEWNFDKEYIEAGALENVSYIVHLAGAGVADGRWTKERKEEIVSSRTKSIRLILKKLKEQNIKPKALVTASGSNYYGEDTGNLRHPENSPAGHDFLAKVCVEWEEAADAAQAMGIRTVKLRTGMVISGAGGALPRMAFPAKFGFGAPLGSGDQWVSWIHIDDLCNLYIKSLEDETWEGAYNAATASPVSNKDLTKQICKTLNKPQWLPNVPAFALKLALGEMANVVLGSNYIINQRITEETNFMYQFLSLENALGEALK